MAAPTATIRGTPAGIKMCDGHSTVISAQGYLTISFWEKGVTPPGIDGGEPIEHTTMHNVVWRTMCCRSLKSLTPVTVRAGWDPNLYVDILTLINRNTSWSIEFPDGSKITFFACLTSFEPDEMVEGEQPEATLTITPTNFDPTNHVEAGPLYTNVAGT